MSNEIFTTVELAELLKTSASSISRAARKLDIGVRRSDGRLVGIMKSDVPLIKKNLHYLSGNPTWRSDEKKKTAQSRALQKREGN